MFHLWHLRLDGKDVSFGPREVGTVKSLVTSKRYNGKQRTLNKWNKKTQDYREILITSDLDHDQWFRYSTCFEPFLCQAMRACNYHGGCARKLWKIQDSYEI